MEVKPASSISTAVRYSWANMIFNTWISPPWDLFNTGNKRDRSGLSHSDAIGIEDLCTVCGNDHTNNTRRSLPNKRRCYCSATHRGLDQYLILIVGIFAARSPIARFRLDRRPKSTVRHVAIESREKQISLFNVNLCIMMWNLQWNLQQKSFE